MATNRKIIFANEEIYHVFNRGVERRKIFMSKREYVRAYNTLNFYQFTNCRKKYSDFLNLEAEEKTKLWNSILSNSPKKIEILAYCFMPNHFHLIIKQKVNSGISNFMSKFTNSYTKYFNTKHQRVGPLFQGVFKAVHVETDEQLMHLSRYIHLNPVTAFLIKLSDLEAYQWSSYNEYLQPTDSCLLKKSEVLDLFDSPEKYRDYVCNFKSFNQEHGKIQHLTLD